MKLICCNDNLPSGTYRVTVNAYSPINGSSTKTSTFSTNGQRTTAPIVITDKDEYSSGELIHFDIDTQNAEEVFIKYLYYIDGRRSGSGTKTIIPTNDSTAWEYTLSNNHAGYTFEFSFSVKRDGKWSKWEKIIKTIQDIQ